MTAAWGGLLAVPLAAAAQPPGKAVRIGLLDAGASNASSEARWTAFRERLRELGYEEGRNAVFEVRWGDGDIARLPGLAAGLVASKVDLVVTVTTEAALAVRQVTTSVPVVMATGGDPVAYGLARSLARPGGNVTGVTSLNNQLIGKRLELLKQLIPRASRVAFLREPDNRTSVLAGRAAESVGKSLGLVVQTVDMRDRGHVDETFRTATRARCDAVILGVNTPFVAHRQRLAELALSYRLPMMAPAKEFAEAGALVSYGTDYPDLFRRAALYVDRVLKGARPADLPVEQPTKFELVINLRTARVLGLTIPPAVRLRADQVID